MPSIALCVPIIPGKEETDRKGFESVDGRGQPPTPAATVGGEFRVEAPTLISDRFSRLLGPVRVGSRPVAWCRSPSDGTWFRPTRHR